MCRWFMTQRTPLLYQSNYNMVNRKVKFIINWPVIVRTCKGTTIHALFINEHNNICDAIEHNEIGTVTLDCNIVVIRRPIGRANKEASALAGNERILLKMIILIFSVFICSNNSCSCNACYDKLLYSQLHLNEYNFKHGSFQIQ